jgi:hypothetical protein
MHITCPSVWAVSPGMSSPSPGRIVMTLLPTCGELFRSGLNFDVCNLNALGQYADMGRLRRTRTCPDVAFVPALLRRLELQQRQP